MAEAPKLGPWHPPDWSRQPDGMTWQDWQAWRPWLASTGRTWPLYTYNLLLSAGEPETPIANPADAILWARLTAKRIDAVGYRDGAYTIFEARETAGWSAVGQLMGYEQLWHLNFGLPLAGLHLITVRCDSAIRATAALHGIVTWCADEQR